MNPVLIAISGKRFAGKDFLADKLKQTLGVMAHKWAFGDAFKQQFSQESGTPLADLYHRVRKEIHRPAMEAWGKKKFQAEGPVFCRLHQEHIKRLETPIVIVPDLRFSHELAHLKTLPTVFVRVEASEATRLARGWVWDDHLDTSASECEMDQVMGWDVVHKTDGDTILDIVSGHIARKALKIWIHTNLP
jgi:phosphomevalonate kinase